MKHEAFVPLRRRRGAVLALALAAAVGSYALPRAQAPFDAAQGKPTKKVLTVADYPKWRTLSGQEISGDGNWVVYGQAFTNTVPTEAKPVLHIVRVENNVFSPATITVTATIDADGAFDNTASVSSEITDPDLTDNTDDDGNGGSTTPSADLSIVKTLTTAGPFTVGQSVTFINSLLRGMQTAISGQ